MNTSDPSKETQEIANSIRKRVLSHTLKNNGGYLSQACSSAEILASLYHQIMTLGPTEGPVEPKPFPGVPNQNTPNITGALYNGPRASHLDRFFFSPVHYALVLYSTLIEMGRLGPTALDLFNQDGSSVELIGAEHSPGHEVTAGSLGQTLSQAGGVALARKIRNEPGKTWVFMSDGEFQEGQTYEALAALAYHGLNNVGIYIDANGYQCDGKMDEVMSIEPLADRLRSFGAVVREVDGHSIVELVKAGRNPHPEGFLAVICRTNPCQGISLLQNRIPKLHYVRFRSEVERSEYRILLSQF